jgi:hypothetical protein
MKIESILTSLGWIIEIFMNMVGAEVLNVNERVEKGD